MSNRVEKPRAVSSINRQKLLLFDVVGFEVMPCDRCVSKGLRCVKVEDDLSRSRKCGECVRSKARCVGMGRALSSRGCPRPLVSPWSLTVLVAERIAYEFRRLEREEEQAAEDFLAFQQQSSAGLTERAARLVRLQKQKKLVREKGVKMVERGLNDLDELEALEAAEAQATTSVAAAATVDWPPVNSGG